MNGKIECITYTPTASFKYTMKIGQLESSNLLNFEDKKRFDAMCVSGCPNYNKKWSCPPNAPNYSKYITGYINIIIFFIQININQFSYIKYDYLKIKAANTIIKSKADRYIRELAVKYGKYISTGSCRLCKPCKRKVGLPCLHPEKIAYSYEAMGIDVNTLVEKYFDTKLLWYKKGQLPEYTSVVCGILTSALYSFDTLKNEYNELIKSEKSQREKNEGKN